MDPVLKVLEVLRVLKVLVLTVPVLPVLKGFVRPALLPRACTAGAPKHLHP